MAVRSTTILAVRRGGRVALGGDGQVTLGDTVLKQKACKVRKMYNGNVLAGFAGASADAFALFERFESKLEEFNGNLRRAAVELAKEWKTEKALRKLDALLIVADREISLLISGDGDVIEPDDEVIAIGTGAGYATAAARAYIDCSDLDAKSIVERSLRITSSICVYTNDKITVEEL